MKTEHHYNHLNGIRVVVPSWYWYWMLPKTGIPSAMRPSPGYGPNDIATGDGTGEADALRKAMKGLGTDEDTLIDILVYPDPLQIALIRTTYENTFGRSLEKDIKSDTSGLFQLALVGLAGGPLGHDITWLNKSLSALLNPGDGQAVADVILGRSHADLQALCAAYSGRYGKSLVEKIRSKIKAPVGEFLARILKCKRPEKSPDTEERTVDADARELYELMTNKELDEIKICNIFLGFSDERLMAIDKALQANHNLNFAKLLQEQTTGFLQSMLIQFILSAHDPVAYIAEVLSSACPTAQAADLKRFLYLLIRFHWDPNFDAAKTQLRDYYGIDLRAAIRNKFPSGSCQTLALKLYDGQ